MINKTPHTATWYTAILMLFISCSTTKTDEFVIANPSSIRTIYIHENTDELIKWAVNDLVEDLQQITARNVNLVTTNAFHADSNGIYISAFSDELTKSLPDNFSEPLENEWEKYIIKKHDENLFLVGSDVRGTVYAVFDLAEQLGISPWKWWADVVPLKKETLTIELSGEGIVRGPSVQFRGIFLNDEDWGLQPWAAKTFEPETEDIGPKTYEKIFQLLLRLKANTIWPAMHPSTTAFFKIPGNREMAEKYHIHIGTSHAEPMLRNNVDEWNKDVHGAYNYFTNSESVKAYWQERISEAKSGEHIITLGMRGIHDSGMEGNATKEEKVKLLEEIFSDQRAMLTTTFNKPIEDIPQVFTVYKEVLELYGNGLQIPDDVTLMWTDDNYGYIRKLSDPEEQQRKGGSGVYYHLSYWGRPHDYLWLATTQPGLIWYEMSRAYQNGAKKIWIANVGDIKPCEYAMEFFLDLAWDVQSIDESSIKQHAIDWSAREFGTQPARKVADIMEEYYRLAFLRKPEFMGWSQTERTTPTRVTEFTPDEAQRRMDAYMQLVKAVDQVKLQIPAERQDAYYQLVEYPVKGAALMNQKFLYAQQSFYATDPNDKTKLANLSEEAYHEIFDLTSQYNTDVSHGKWQHIMSMNPRNLPVYNLPEYHLTEVPEPQMPWGEQSKEQPIFIQAKDFSTHKSFENYTWRTVEDLGYSNASVTLFPLDNHAFSEEKPYLEYLINIETPGKYMIEIRCIPNHSNDFSNTLDVEVNGKDRQSFIINTKGRSNAWKINTLRNYASVTYPATFKNAGKQSLKVYVNQTGIVLDQLSISPENSPKHYEIVK